MPGGIGIGTTSGAPGGKRHSTSIAGGMPDGIGGPRWITPPPAAHEARVHAWPQLIYQRIFLNIGAVGLELNIYIDIYIYIYQLSYLD